MKKNDAGLKALEVKVDAQAAGGIFSYPSSIVTKAGWFVLFCGLVLQLTNKTIHQINEQTRTT